MMVNKGKFLNDEQKVEFFAGRSKVNLCEYPHQETVKIYEGVELLLYHYDSDESLVFDTVVICTGFTVTGKGMIASFIDRRSYATFTIGDLPLNVLQKEILAHAPPRCLLERTVKVTQQNKKIQGMTATVIFRTKSAPFKCKAGHVQVIPLTKARRTLGEAAFDAAAARAEEENQ